MCLLSALYWMRKLFTRKQQVRSRKLSRPALCTALMIQVLETRALLAADLEISIPDLIAIPGESIAAEVRYFNGDDDVIVAPQDGEFRDLISESLFTVSIKMDNPRGGIFVGDSFQVFGQHEGQAAIEVDGEIIYFESLLSAPGLGESTEGRINGAALLQDGTVIYVGESAGLAFPDQPTYWFDPMNPIQQLNSVGTLSSGWLAAVSDNGTFVGISGGGGAPAYGDPSSGIFSLLPGFTNAGARDITRDSQYIVGGDFIWHQNDLGGYNVLSTSDFDFSEPGIMPNFIGVELDGAGNPFFAGEFFSLDTFSTFTGFWNLDGNHLGSVEGSYAGMAVIDGMVIAAVNGWDEGILVSLPDGDSIPVSELLGSPAFFGTFPPSWNGIFSTDDALGLLLRDEDGLFVSVHGTTSTANPEVKVDIFIDTTGDGVFDLEFLDTDFAQFELTFPSAGTYTVTVVAMNGSSELGRITQEVVVESFRVEDRDGLSVLVIGADQITGSDILVIDVNGGKYLNIDGQTSFVQAESVKIFGSPEADRVLLIGNFDASVFMNGGNDKLRAIGLNDLEADLGKGDNTATLIRVDSVHIIAGDGSNSITSIGLNEVESNLGDGGNSATHIAVGSVILWSGSGDDTVISIGHRVAWIDTGAGNDFVFAPGSQQPAQQTQFFRSGGQNLQQVNYTPAASAGTLHDSTATVDLLFQTFGRKKETPQNFPEFLLKALDLLFAELGSGKSWLMPWSELLWNPNDNADSKEADDDPNEEDEDQEARKTDSDHDENEHSEPPMLQQSVFRQANPEEQDRLQAVK